jgi:hypothetical protein
MQNRREFVFLRWSIQAVLVSMVLLPAAGCGSDRVEVSGRVTRKDGSPVVGAKITMRSPGTGKTVIGYTDRDGQYTVGSEQAGEGLLPGKYYVIVHEDRGSVVNPAPRTIHEKYELPSTSGLALTVEPGGETAYDVVLDPP